MLSFCLWEPDEDEAEQRTRFEGSQQGSLPENSVRMIGPSCHKLPQPISVSLNTSYKLRSIAISIHGFGGHSQMLIQSISSLCVSKRHARLCCPGNSIKHVQTLK